MDHPLLSRTLAQDGAFVRLLARSLVRDPQRADDLVQDTWLRFLERTPSGPGNLRHWFRTVARNLAASGARGERNRIEREAHAARPEALPSAADDYEHAEMMRNVIDAVLTLDEPYRSTLLARYYRGWSSRRVASETKTPLATVRSREQRALEQLRAKLDRQAGGRAAWGLALGKLLALEPAIALPAGGTIAVGLGLTGGVVLVAGLAWSVARGSHASVVPSAAPPVAAEAEPVALHSTASAREAELPAVAASEPSTPPVGPGAQPLLAAPPSEIRARFVFSDGTPAGGVVGKLELGRKVEHNASESQEGEPPVWEDQTVTSGSDGHVAFVFTKPAEYSLDLVAALDGYVSIHWDWFEIAPGAVLDLGDAAMLHGGAVTGHLVRPNGAPILGEAWRLDVTSLGHASPDGRGETRVHGAIDPATGAFRIEGAMPGTNALSAQSPTAGWLKGPKFTLVEGGEAAVDFVYDGPDNSRRIFVDVSMQRFHTIAQPLAEHVRLLAAGAPTRSAQPSPNGSTAFVFEDVDPGQYTIEIDDPRCALWRKENVSPGARVSARLQGNSAVVLDVGDEGSGASVTSYTVKVTLHNQRTFPNTFEFDAAKLAGGRIDGMFAGDSTIEARAGESVGSAEVLGLAVGETRAVAIALVPRPVVEGHARFGDGTPVPGLAATLLRPALIDDSSLSQILHLGGFTTDDRSFRVEVAAATTDGTGAFRLVAPQAGTYLVRIAGDDGTEVYSAPLALAGGPSAPLELVVSRSGSLSGHVLVPSGASLAGLRVWAVPESQLGRLEAARTSVALGNDGAFAIPSVAAGPAKVFLILPPTVQHQGGGWSGGGIGWYSDRPMFARELGSVDVPAGGSLEHEFTSEDFPGTVELTVRVNGQPAPRLALNLRTGEAENVEILEAETDDHGVFGPFPLFEGTWTVEAVDPEAGWQAPNPQPVVITRAHPTITTLDFERP